jgi:hypothetical protein
MQGEYCLENSGAGGHRAHRRASDPRMIAERQQEPCHPLRTLPDLAMLLLVPGQIAALDRFSQRRGLTECQAKPLARDRIDRSGGIAD